jgi:hypothetical protein
MFMRQKNDIPNIICESEGFLKNLEHAHRVYTDKIPKQAPGYTPM